MHIINSFDTFLSIITRCHIIRYLYSQLKTNIERKFHFFFSFIIGNFRFFKSFLPLECFIIKVDKISNLIMVHLHMGTGRTKSRLGQAFKTDMPVVRNLGRMFFINGKYKHEVSYCKNPRARQFLKHINIKNKQ